MKCKFYKIQLHLMTFVSRDALLQLNFSGHIGYTQQAAVFIILGLCSVSTNCVDHV